MEVASLPSKESKLSVQQRIGFLVKGLEDISPLVRYKAHVALTGMRLDPKVVTDLKRNGLDPDVTKAYVDERSRLVPRLVVHRGHRMVVIPKGLAVVGSDSDEKNEGPAFELPVESYAIDEDLVSNGVWNRIMNGEVPAFEQESVPELRKSRLDKGRASRPVLGVSYERAKHFCEVSGRRLPTEVEWEVAARGYSGWLFPWGDETSVNAQVLAEEAKYDKIPGDIAQIMAVAELSDGHAGDVSPFGVKRMATAVRQWTSSEYRPEYAVPHSGSTCLNQCSTRGAAGSEGVSEKGNEHRMRASRRVPRAVNHADDSIGFRCAMTVK